MNNSWPKVKLGEVISHRKEFVRIDDLRTYKRCRVQLYAKGIVLRDFVTGSELKTKEQQICRSGDFLVAEIDAKVGGYGIVPDELEGAIVSSHYFLFEVDRTRLDRNFLGYFIKTPDFFDQVSARGTTNYAAIRPSHVLEYQIPLPALEEQRWIVAKVDELAAKIEEAGRLRREAMEEVEALKSAGRGLILASAVREFGAPRLEEVTTRITKGESPEWQGFSYQEEGPLFIRSENVLWGKLDARPAVRIPEQFHMKLSRSKLNPGDVLINLVGASIGRACSVPEGLGPANINQAVAVISPQLDRLLPEFLVYFLLSPVAQDTIHGGKVETARPNISLGDLRDLKVPLPPLSEQKSVVAELDELQANVDASNRIQAEAGTKLEALLPSILDKAFKGEL
jgi:type I restriction enzyme S subunit